MVLPELMLRMSGGNVTINVDGETLLINRTIPYDGDLVSKVLADDIE